MNLRCILLRRKARDLLYGYYSCRRYLVEDGGGEGSLPLLRTNCSTSPELEVPLHISFTNRKVSGCDHGITNEKILMLILDRRYFTKNVSRARNRKSLYLLQLPNRTV